MAKGDGLKKRVPFTKNDPRINKEGRPKKLPNLDKLLANELGESEAKEGSEAQAIIQSLIKEAKKGNVKAAEVLLERGYGKVKQTTELTGGLEVNQTGDISVLTWIKDQLNAKDKG